MLFENVLRRAPFLYRRARRLVEELDAGDADAIRIFREENLRSVLARAGRLKSNAYPKDGPFERIPLLSKDRVLASPDAFIASSVLPISKRSTSGTTGTALTVERCPWCVTFEQAVIDHVVGKIGGDLHHDRVAVFRGNDIKAIDDLQPPFWRLERSGRWLVFSSNHLSRATFAQYVAALRDFSPMIIYAYPSVVEQLLLLMESSGTKIHVPMICTSSEVLSLDLRRRLAEAFGARIVDYYGQAERVAAAYSIDQGGYRFIPSYSHVEFDPLPRMADDDDDLTSYEIVGTAYHNTRQLLLRYRTGDIVRLGATDLQAIAEGRTLFGGIAGRSNHVLWGPGGELLVGIDQIPRGLEGFGRFQFVQRAPDLVDILVLDPTGGSPERAKIILDRARVKVPSTIAVEIHFAEELQRTKEGKIPFVVHAAAHRAKHGATQKTMPTQPG